MIRIQKLTANTNYYVDTEEQYLSKKDYEDYLTKSNHVPAQFLGEYFDGLEYSREKYQALAKGQNPITYENLTRGGTENAGYDIVVAMPKSYSMLYAAADDNLKEQLNQIQQDVIKQYYTDAAKLIRPAGSGEEYRGFDPEQTKIAAASFWHIENRELEPHLHNHGSLFNFAEFTMADGQKKTFAINAQELYAKQKEMNAELNLNLCDKLQEIGIHTIGTKDGFRVVGITEEQEKMFSSRRQDMLEFMEEQRQQGKYFSSQKEAENEMIRETARNATKKEKANLNNREILEYQKNQLAERGITLENILEYQQEYVHTKPEIIEQVIIRDATALSGVVSETDLRRRIHEINMDLPLEERIKFNDFIRRNELIRVDLDDRNKGYTTNEIVITEMQNIEAAQKLARGDYDKLQLNENATQIKEQTIAKINANLAQYGAKLNEGQEDACRLIAQHERITLIEGDAGTGKTTTAIKFTNDYYSAQGYEVIGLATQGKTSKSLQDADIKNTQNLSQFFIKEPSGSRRVLVVDEAGMTGAEQYRQLLRYAEDNPDTKVVFVGDQKQLASVAYGTSFENLRENLSQDHQRRLWENTRQRTQEQREIAEAARDKQPDKALELLRKNEGLHETKTREEAIEKIAQDYVKCDKSKVAIAYTNDDVNAINDAIRRELTQAGKLDMSQQHEFEVKVKNELQQRNFIEGEPIILTAKLKKNETQQELVNGTEATIKKINGNKITIEADGKDYNFDAKKFNSFNHAYCLTTHKSQGITVSEGFIYSNGNDPANRNYVNLSRHKDSTNLYIAKENVERYIERASIGEGKANVTKDQNCIDRYQYIKEQRQHLLADPYNTENQIKDIQAQIVWNGNDPDIRRRLDQMHRLDGILKDLQKEKEGIQGQRTAYEEWRQVQQDKKGVWTYATTKAPVSKTVESKLEKAEQENATKTQTAEQIKAQLKADIEKMKREQYQPTTDKTKEQIKAEVKQYIQKQSERRGTPANDRTQEALREMQRQITMDELEEVKQGHHQMTPLEYARREEQIEKLEKLGEAAEPTIEKLKNQLDESGIGATKHAAPKNRAEILAKMHENIKNPKPITKPAPALEKSGPGLVDGIARIVPVVQIAATITKEVASKAVDVVTKAALPKEQEKDRGGFER